MAERERSPLGRLLKELREARGLTQERLSEMTGHEVKAAHIGRIEAPGGTLGASPDKLDLLAAALELSVAQRSELFRAAGKMPEPQTDLIRRLEAVERQVEQTTATVEELVSLLQQGQAARVARRSS